MQQRVASSSKPSLIPGELPRSLLIITICYKLHAEFQLHRYKELIFPVNELYIDYILSSLSFLKKIACEIHPYAFGYYS